MKTLIATILCLITYSAWSATLAKLSLAGIPFGNGRLEISSLPNGDLSNLSTVISLTGKTKSRSFAQLLSGGQFPITKSKQLMGHITIPNRAQFNPTSGGGVRLTILKCDGGTSAHDLTLALDANRRWKLSQGTRVVREVVLRGPVMSEACLNSASFE